MSRVPPVLEEAARAFRRPAERGDLDEQAGVLDGVLHPARPPRDTAFKLRAGGEWASLVTHPSASAATVASADLLATELLRLSGHTAARV